MARKTEACVVAFTGSLDSSLFNHYPWGFELGHNKKSIFKSSPQEFSIGMYVKTFKIFSYGIQFFTLYMQYHYVSEHHNLGLFF